MAKNKNPQGEGMIWANLLHLSFNMWRDRENPDMFPNKPDILYKPYLRCEKSFWNALLRDMSETGLNMVLIDLGDAVRYESRPGIAVKGAWSGKYLRKELDKTRKMGLEPIPKLNFSACHDLWMGEYSRRVSSPEYYKVCADLISEVSELFDSPRFFHLGMDEENYRNQRFQSYVVIRQYELWWHDLYFMVEQLEKKGVRAWVWSDCFWTNPDAFMKRMPKDVLQSNWYYGKSFSKKIPAVNAYVEIGKAGYEQVPTGSTWNFSDNFSRTVRFCKKHIPAESLKGFMQTAWRPSLEKYSGEHLSALQDVSKGMKLYG